MLSCSTKAFGLAGSNTNPGIALSDPVIVIPPFPPSPVVGFCILSIIPAKVCVALAISAVIAPAAPDLLNTSII